MKSEDVFFDLLEKHGARPSLSGVDWHDQVGIICSVFRTVLVFYKMRLVSSWKRKVVDLFILKQHSRLL